ncbi:MAG: PIN domain-containing protein [Isosphaeraceae bacterium]
MRRVFVDTLYWIAITSRKDQWHRAAEKASRSLGGCHLVTTDEVLIEVLNAFCEAGPSLRQEGIALIRDLFADPTVTVHPQSRQTITSGLALYEARPDKEYSLTDCISMVTMREEGITDVLTHDAHFAQEGFTSLL